MNKIKKIKVLDSHWFEKHQKILLFMSNAFLIKSVFRRILGIHRTFLSKQKVLWISSKEILLSPITVNNKRREDYCYTSYGKFQVNLFKNLYYLWVLFHLWDLLVDKRIPELSFGFETLFESYNPTTDNTSYASNSSWRFQGFTPSVAHTIERVVGKWAKSVSTGNVSIDIKLAGGDSKPTGASLASDSDQAISTLPVDGGGDGTVDTSFPLATTGAITAALHCMILSAATAGGEFGIRALVVGAYAGGSFWSSADSGATWSDISWDMRFEEYGTATATFIPKIIIM